MAAITYGTAKIEGEASFRIPFGLFFVIPFIVGACAYFLSEVRVRFTPLTPKHTHSTLAYTYTNYNCCI